MFHILLAVALTPSLSTALASTSLELPKAGDAVISIAINDAPLPAAAALDVTVDGAVKSTVLIFGKVGHPAYTALLHALAPGRHEIALQPSPYWTWPPSAAAPTLTAFAAPDSVVVAHAPALWLRADTVGTSSDLRSCCTPKTCG